METPENTSFSGSAAGRGGEGVNYQSGTHETGSNCAYTASSPGVLYCAVQHARILPGAASPNAPRTVVGAVRWLGFTAFPRVISWTQS